MSIEAAPDRAVTIARAAERYVTAEHEMKAADAAWNQLRIGDSTRRCEKAKQELAAAWKALEQAVAQ